MSKKQISKKIALFVNLILLLILPIACSSRYQPVPNCQIIHPSEIENDEVFADPYIPQIEWIPAIVGGSGQIRESEDSSTLIEGQSIRMELNGTDITSHFEPSPNDVSVLEKTDSSGKFTFKAPSMIYGEGLQILKVFCEGNSYSESDFFRFHPAEFEVTWNNIDASVGTFVDPNLHSLPAASVYSGATRDLTVEIPKEQIFPVEIMVTVIEAKPNTDVIELNGEFPATSISLVIPPGETATTISVYGVIKGNAILSITSPGYEEFQVEILVDYEGDPLPDFPFPHMEQGGG